MKTEVAITFICEQRCDDSTDKNKFEAHGTLEKVGDVFVVEYVEPDEAMGKSVSAVHVFEKTLVHLRRSGLYQTNFVIEHNKKHRCVYKTPFGEMDMDIFADEVFADVSENGGDIRLKYKLESDSGVIAENSLHLIIKTA